MKQLLKALCGWWPADPASGAPAAVACAVPATRPSALLPCVPLAGLADAAAVPRPAPYLLVVNTNAALAGGQGFYYNAGSAATPAWRKLTFGVAPASGPASLADRLWALVGLGSL